MIKRGYLPGYLCWFTLAVTIQGFANPQKVLPDDGNAEDQFGYSVAIDGTTALVGAHKADVNDTRDAGAAYIFTLGPSGWKQQAKLIAEPAHADDTLGGNVALAGDIAMLGVMRRDDKAEDAGAVFAFEREAESWTQAQVITPPDARAGDGFGQSIALTDQFLVIGAPRSDAPLEDSGSAYVFVRDRHSWLFHSRLTANDGAAGDLFGISVAIDGETVLVGADLNDQQAENAGAVYVYAFDGGQWDQQAKLMAEDGGHTDLFGVRVALSGDTALISARRDDIEGVGADAGSAYIFERKEGQWIQSQKLVAPDPAADDRFARGVALNKETALISAIHHDANGNNAGAVYVYKNQDGKWRYASKIMAGDSAPEDRFGWNVALDDRFAIIAAPHRDDNGNASGVAYIQLLK